jgi:Tol biopolymer transport system component/DNA-binding winged helix-turn-helix (wHTH) protein
MSEVQYKFAEFQLDCASFELRRQGRAQKSERISLERIPMELLILLLERQGSVVTRQEIVDRLWGKDVFVDTEHGINTAIRKVRQALKDDPDNPRFIHTVSGKGYRFVAEKNGRPETPELVEGRTPGTSSGPDIPTALPSALTNVCPIESHVAPGLFKVETSPPAKHVPSRRRAGLTPWVIALLLCVATALGVRLSKFLRNLDEIQSQDTNGVRVIPLTSLPGREISPSFSPDGSQVVFGWDGGNGTGMEPFDLYVKAIGSESVERLTNNPAEWIVPAWSPDGGTIAFARSGQSNSGILLIPSRGTGGERRLADTVFTYTPPITLNWSPDGKYLTYYSADRPYVLTVATGTVRVLALPPGCHSAYAPTFSPDGKTIAFNCYINDLSNDVYIVPTAGGPARMLATVNSPVPPPMTWTNDGQRILLTTDFGELLEIEKAGGKPRRLMFAQDAFQPTVSRRGSRLAYVKTYFQTTLVKIRIDAKPSAPAILVPSSRAQRNPNISPDGKRIVFESERAGVGEIWRANTDGTDLVQLSDFRSLTGTPRWSPDGREIVFDSRESGQARLYLVDPETAIPRRIPMEVPGSVPSWSRDGRYIYFSMGSAGSGGLYKIDEHGGNAILISNTPGLNVQEARDGKLYFDDRVDDGEIHVKDGLDGEERPLKGMPKVRFPNDWVLTPTGIYFNNRGPKSASISFFEFALGRVTRRIPLKLAPPIWGGLSVSPDGAWLICAQPGDQESDLMLVEGFH